MSWPGHASEIEKLAQQVKIEALGWHGPPGGRRIGARVGGILLSVLPPPYFYFLREVAIAATEL